MNISFLFRKPKFPIICNIEGYVIAARSKSSFEKQLSAFENFNESGFPLIDVSGEGWSFHPEHMTISPLTLKKKWSKKEVIALFNERENNTSNVIYSKKSLSAKRFDKIFQDIVELLINNS